MSARRKLNGAFALGSFLVAGLLGLVTGSLTVFAVSLGALLLTNVLAGDIRPGKRD
jgi:hypothetical protein